MTDLTSLGYPEGYHLGLSSILWWIFIIVTLIISLGLYLNAKKSDLINVKEILISKSIGYTIVSLWIFMIQVGVFFPNNFLQFFLIGGFIMVFSGTFYFYYWEKNLTSLKRITTISAGASAIVAAFGVIIIIIFPDFPILLLDFFIFATFFLYVVAFALYIYLIYIFSRNVKGRGSIITGWIWMGGMALQAVACLIELPPGVKIFPEFIVLYFPPIIFTVAVLMLYYGITKLFTQISSFYANTQRCAVHRGTIEKGTPIHYCSSCGIVYCETCFNQVIIKDGCWNCRKGAEQMEEKKKESVQILESDKPDKRKVQTE